MKEPAEESEHYRPTGDDMKRRTLMGAAGMAAVAATLGASPAEAVSAERREQGMGGHPSVRPAPYKNPVVETNQPDPHVLSARGRWYLYSTAGDLGRFPVLVSDDLIHWDPVGDGFPELAPWSQAGRHWAPEVIEMRGQFYAYYTARKVASTYQAIGVAVSNSPEGPFVDDSESALVDTDEEGGAIDASPFLDASGQLWLVWKNDGNHDNLPSYIYAQRLSPDGLKLIGERHRLIGMDQEWERYTIEGASIIRHGGRYVMFYSAGEYWNESYGVGYAVADSVEGPWVKGTAPILSANEVAAGPGHGFPFRVRGAWWYVYHAWQPNSIGEDPGRQVWLSPITFTDGVPDIEGPKVKNPVSPKV